MDFAPLNDDHAISEIRFGYILSENLNQDDFDRAKSRHSEIRAELPAIIVAGEGDNKSIEFAHVRPDATSSWSLELEDNLITVTCTRYTRWAKVWSAAEKFLNFGLSVISVDPHRTVVSAAMMVTDEFSVGDSNYDLKSLLKKNDILPLNIFDRRWVWHTNNGWIELSDVGGDAIVHTLRVDCRLEQTASPSDEVVPLSVVMQHAQRLQLQTPLVVGEGAASPLSAGVARMHIGNKSVMTSLLTEAMAERIGLGART